VDGAGTAVGDRGVDAGGGAAECARVGVAEGDGTADCDVAAGEADDADGMDEGVDWGVETPALPHPAASKATSTIVAIFGYVTVGEPRITP
jgi:hypothetical protein